MSREPEIVMQDDLELVTRYLNRQLDPERVAQVRQRLEDDAEFRDFAAPLLLAWSVPRHYTRNPRPIGELEKNWAEFSRRAQLAQERRKARRRRAWMLGFFTLALVAVGITWMTRGPAASPVVATLPVDPRPFEAVMDTANRPDGLTLRNGARVVLESGAQLGVLRSAPDPMTVHVKIAGSARFMLRDPDPADPGSLTILIVETRSARVTGGLGSFSVATRGDTTDVEVLRRARGTKTKFELAIGVMPAVVLVEAADAATPQGQIQLAAGDRARVIHGSAPLLLAAAQTSVVSAPEPNPYQAVADTAGRPDGLTLRDGTRVVLARGAKLSVLRAQPDSAPMQVKLQGSARFMMRDPDFMRPGFFRRLVVETRGALVSGQFGWFEVDARADTTEIALLRRPPVQRASGIRSSDDQLPSIAFVDQVAAPLPTRLQMAAGDRARVVRGNAPLMIADAMPGVVRNSVPRDTGAREPRPVGQRSPSADLIEGRQFDLLADTAGRPDGLTLKNGTRVVLGKDARVTVLRDFFLDSGAVFIKMQGNARFILPDRDAGTVPTGPLPRIVIETQTARISSARGHFDVSARGDTTDVDVIRRKDPVKPGYNPIFGEMPSSVLVDNVLARAPMSQLHLQNGDRARVLRGMPAVLTASDFPPR